MSENQFIFTTKVVEKVRQKFEDGFVISRQEKYWLSSTPLVKKSGLVFSYTDDELLEYTKCKFGIDINGEPFVDEENQTFKQSGIQYFAENYCMIKNEYGKIGNMRLRNYQNEILDLYINNRFSILCGSRQIGKCYLPDTQVVVNGKEEYVHDIWYDSIKNKTFIDKIKRCLYKMYSKL
jgi:hypothetical protein